MPTSNFLNTPLGGASAKKFNIGGITELYILPKDKLGAVTEVLDAFGSVVGVTSIALAGTEKFQEVGFIEGEASFTQTFKRNATTRFYEQSLNFSVSIEGEEANDQTHQIVLNERQVALVKRSTGKMFILGLTKGLVPVEQTANSGAGEDEGGSMTYTLTGGNKGLAPEVTMDAAALAAIVNPLVG